jgi:hypothetical protein
MTPSDSKGHRNSQGGCDYKRLFCHRRTRREGKRKQTSTLAKEMSPLVLKRENILSKKMSK